MSLSQKVQDIEEVFALLNQEISKFQGWAGLSCKAGCGKCCNKADIEATVLEFLPFATYLYQLKKCDDWLARIRDHPNSLCLFFEPVTAGSGHCSQYLYRGLICRLFGFSARTNKYAKPEFVSCQTIKTEQAGVLGHVVAQINHGELVPVMNHYYMRLTSIDRDLARDFYPINEAIKRAIEEVLNYYAYRDDAN